MFLSRSSQNSLPRDLDTRRCRECGDGNMAAYSRQVDFLSIKSVYTCPNCKHEVMLNSGGAMGVYLAVALLATGMLSFIFWGSRDGYNGVVSLKTLAMFTLFASPVWWAAIKTCQYPVTGIRTVTQEEKTDALAESVAVEPLQKGITFMDRLSSLKAFVGVLIIVALFLGAAALIGWVNFTFFNDQLFG